MTRVVSREELERIEKINRERCEREGVSYEDMLFRHPLPKVIEHEPPKLSVEQPPAEEPPLVQRVYARDEPSVTRTTHHRRPRPIASAWGA